jgi:hypothetical protein
MISDEELRASDVGENPPHTHPPGGETCDFCFEECECVGEAACESCGVCETCPDDQCTCCCECADAPEDEDGDDEGDDADEADAEGSDAEVEYSDNPIMRTSAQNWSGEQLQYDLAPDGRSFRMYGYTFALSDKEEADGRFEFAHATMDGREFCALTLDLRSGVWTASSFDVERDGKTWHEAVARQAAMTV